MNDNTSGLRSKQGNILTIACNNLLYELEDVMSYNDSFSVKANIIIDDITDHYTPFYIIGDPTLNLMYNKIFIELAMVAITDGTDVHDLMDMEFENHTLFDYVSVKNGNSRISMPGTGTDDDDIRARMRKVDVGKRMVEIIEFMDRYGRASFYTWMNNVDSPSANLEVILIRL